jgi:hypothetical protein
MEDPSSIKKFPVSEFSTLFCRRIIVNPVTTAYKWDPTHRNAAIQLLGASDTAKAYETKGDEGVLGAVPFVVGETAGEWVFFMYVKGKVRVGMALLEQNLATTDGTAVNQLVNGTEGDLIRFALTAEGVLTIVHEAGAGAIISTTTYDLNANYVGQTLYYWASTVAGYNMSLKVAEDVYFSISTDSDGKSRMHALTNDIVDFSLADIAANDPDAPPIGGGDAITNLVSGKRAKVYDDGSIRLEGGVVPLMDTVPIGLSRLLTTADYAVTVDDPSSGPIVLPAIADVTRGQQYVINRSFPFQVGEDWTTPHLEVLVAHDSGNTIGGDPAVSIGLRPNSSVRLTSDGLNDWIVG